MCGINECTVVEKNVRKSERFFDNHYMFKYGIPGWEVASKRIPQKGINPVGLPLGFSLTRRRLPFYLEVGFLQNRQS